MIINPNDNINNYLDIKDQTIGRIDKADNKFTIGDYAEVASSSTLIGRLYTQLKLCIWEGKGWVNEEAANKILKKIDLDTLNKIQNACNKTISTPEDANTTSEIKTQSKEVKLLVLHEKKARYDEIKSAMGDWSNGAEKLTHDEHLLKKFGQYIKWSKTQDSENHNEKNGQQLAIIILQSADLNDLMEGVEKDNKNKLKDFFEKYNKANDYVVQGDHEAAKKAATKKVMVGFQDWMISNIVNNNYDDKELANFFGTNKEKGFYSLIEDDTLINKLSEILVKKTKDDNTPKQERIQKLNEIANELFSKKLNGSH